jgi:hypothetical protein
MTRQPKPQRQRHHQRRYSRACHAPFAQCHPRHASIPQQRVYFTPMRLGTGPVAAGAGLFVVEVLDDMQVQTWLRAIAPLQVS